MLRRARRASPETDARGVDLFVELNVGKGKQKNWMTVPIQIKSSEWGVKKWEVTHPEHVRAGVLHFYILDSMSERGLCRLFYGVLKKVQRKSRGGTLYHGWFQKLYEGRMSRRGRENVRNIKARRAREKKR